MSLPFSPFFAFLTPPDSACLRKKLMDNEVLGAWVSPKTDSCLRNSLLFIQMRTESFPKAELLT